MQLSLKTVFRKLAIVFICATLVSACGFHLRGTQGPQLAQLKLFLKLNDPYGQFENEVKRLLLSANVQIVESVEDAEMKLSILRARTEQKGVGREASGRASEFELTFIAEYQLENIEPSEDPAKTNLRKSEKRQLVQSRSYFYDSDATEGKLEEENALRQDMYRSASLRLLSIVSTQFQKSKSGN